MKSKERKITLCPRCKKLHITSQVLFKTWNEAVIFSDDGTGKTSDNLEDALEEQDRILAIIQKTGV